MRYCAHPSISERARITKLYSAGQKGTRRDEGQSAIVPIIALYFLFPTCSQTCLFGCLKLCTLLVSDLSRILRFTVASSVLAEFDMMKIGFDDICARCWGNSSPSQLVSTVLSDSTVYLPVLAGQCLKCCLEEDTQARTCTVVH